MSESLTVEDVPREQPVQIVPVADDVRARFPRDVARHKMTVLHDDGLYRHLRFRAWVEVEKDGQPTGKWSWSSPYWFDLITWPGCLAINGDMESFLFSRTEDMFEFFRGHQPNPSYWAEKVRAGSRIREYSEERFRERIAEYAGEDEQRDWPGLAGAISAEILGNGDACFEEGARQLLDGFEFGATVTANCSCGTVSEGITSGNETRWEIGHRAAQPGGLTGFHRVTWKQVEGFRFTDAWEWDLSDWNYQFLWCCHAIPWGISVYDKMRAAAATVTA